MEARASMRSKRRVGAVVKNKVISPEKKIAEVLKEFRRRGGTDTGWLIEELQKIKEETDGRLR